MTTKSKENKERKRKQSQIKARFWGFSGEKILCHESVPPPFTGLLRSIKKSCQMQAHILYFR